MRPPDQRDAVAIDVGSARQVGERTQRVQPAPDRRDGTLAALERAHLGATARTEAVGEQHGVAVAEKRLGTRSEPLREQVVATSSCRVHAAATVQCDDRRKAAWRHRPVGEKQKPLKLNRRAVVMVERRKRHARQRPRIDIGKRQERQRDRPRHR